ncbi:MAG: sulfite exporter TauE/SafE family protein [Clostridia bacterium]|nr:sulfite exporter TauE/SafE family protein [Clostridia bacterium]
MEIIAGIISGAIASWGMGGGALLISLLSNFFNINQHTAQATNLIFFIPTSLCSVIINAKNKNIKYKLGTQIIVFGIIGAAIGALLSNKIEKNILRKIFGIMLIIIAIIEIYNFYKMYIKHKNRHNNNK